MTRFNLIMRITAALAGTATFVDAQTSPSTGPGVTPATSPVLAPPSTERAPAPSAPKRTRAVSDDVAAALSAVSPKYTPPPPPPPEPKPEAEQVDLRDVDKPKNGIVRLPKYMVREPKPPVFRERDIYTEKGLTDLAMRKFISDMDRALNRWTLPLFGTSKESRAMAMYAEEERLKNMADLHDAAVSAAKSDRGQGGYILREAQQTYLRTSDFGWNGGGPK
jgi:hypothetical protein